MTQSSFIRNSAFEIGNLQVMPGKAEKGELPVAKLVTGSRISLPLHVLNGTKPGPVVWMSAAIHGDEVAGVEIIRQVTERINPKKMEGTVIAVPIVNVHGFLSMDRYLPDRRDLNRSFPGSPKGSLGSRIAFLFMREIVSRCDMGIDLHTGSDSRINLPQVRADLDNPELRKLCSVFGAPVMLHSHLRDGSLREAASDRGTKVLLYEGGEANRMESGSIRTGTNGILRVLQEMGMIKMENPPLGNKVIECRRSSWLRARKSGLALLNVLLGDRVEKGQELGIIHDSVGNRLGRILAQMEGIVIGKVQQPLVNQGDAVVHIAEVYKP